MNQQDFITNVLLPAVVPAVVSSVLDDSRFFAVCGDKFFYTVPGSKWEKVNAAQFFSTLVAEYNEYNNALARYHAASDKARAVFELGECRAIYLNRAVRFAAHIHATLSEVEFMVRMMFRYGIDTILAEHEHEYSGFNMSVPHSVLDCVERSS